MVEIGHDFPSQNLLPGGSISLSIIVFLFGQIQMQQSTICFSKISKRSKIFVCVSAIAHATWFWCSSTMLQWSSSYSQNLVPGLHGAYPITRGLHDHWL